MEIERIVGGGGGGGGFFSVVLTCTDLRVQRARHSVA
jgi:hypothetical protein